MGWSSVWGQLKRFLAQANTWTGQQTFSNIVVTGGTISGVTAAENFTTSTDPAANAAVTTAIVNTYNGVVVTLTAAGNTQTIQNPTTAATIRKFMVINNDTSNNNLSVVANSVTFTLTPGEGQCFIWDGSAWGPTDLGITAIPVPIAQGGTGQVTATAAMNALGVPSATAESDFIVSGASPFAWAKKTIAEAKALLHAAPGAIGGTTPAAITGTTITANTGVTMGDAAVQLWDIAPASDHTWSGDTEPGTAGENVALGDVCYLKSDGKWWIADADASTTMPGMRIATAAISADASGTFLKQGVFRDDSWNWTAGGTLYVSTAGTGSTLTQTAPSGDQDCVQIAGYALTADVIMFDPSPVIAVVGLDLEAKDAGYTITFAELSSIPKVFTCDDASDQTFGFAAPVTADIGKQFWLVKDGTAAGKIILDAPAGVIIDDSNAGGTCYCNGGAIASGLFLVLSATYIQKIAATGTWTTT